jgi:molybdopterin molybdotransferase
VIALDEAKRFVLEGLVPLTPVVVALDEALGCVAGEQVLAREAVPGFVNSSMDGFALRSSDTSSGSARLSVTDSVYAGDVSSLRLETGQAMRIMTGAPLPEGADCVCMIEEATVDGHEVLISRAIASGEFLRHVGDCCWHCSDSRDSRQSIWASRATPARRSPELFETVSRSATPSSPQAA